jgi:cation diffusion facilitator CzcD-associated flavoprotein CzcO
VDKSHEMTTVFPTKRVAVIGAGISGVVAAAHLLAVGGLDVTVFERNKAAGGVWYVILCLPAFLLIGGGWPELLPNGQERSYQC